MFSTIGDIERANTNLGHCWFSADTMQAWDTRIESEVIGGYWFITSEAHPSGPQHGRVYSIRHAASDGDVHTDRRTNVGDYSGTWTAREEIDRLLRTLSTCGCE
jgi:hypothetical protein